MGKTDLNDYKKLYLRTAREYLDNLSTNCAKLSANLQDKDAVNAIHISSHSLKSQSQVMGFFDITVLSETIEKRSRDILTEAAQIDNTFTILLKKSIDEISLKLAQIEKGDAETSSA